MRVTGGVDAEALAVRMAQVRDAAQGLAGRPMMGLRAVAPGTGGLAWLVAFEGPSFLCMDDDLRPAVSLARVQDVAQASIAAEVVEEALDAGALRALAPVVAALDAWRHDVPAAAEALDRASAHAAALADWRDAPERVVASLVQLDAAVAMQERAHAAYATFVGVTEPLVERQDQLDPGLVAALTAVEQAAAAAGLGSSLGTMLGQGMGGIAEAADEMAASHLTPLR